MTSSTHNWPISQLVKPQTVVILHTRDSVQQALEKLSNANITSAPVLDEQGKIHGFLDVVDLVAHLIKVVRKERSSNTTPVSASLSTDDIDLIAKRSAEFNVTSILEIIKKEDTRHDGYYPVRANGTLQDLLEVFKRGIHRVALTNESNQIVHILTQSDLIRYLAEDPTRLGLTAEDPVSKLNLVQQGVVTVNEKATTIEAFELLFDKKLTSLAIVNDLGALVGTISPSDLKGIKSILLTTLLQPVSEYISNIRKQQGKSADFLVHATWNTPVKTLVSRIASQRVHRAFIVDDAFKPVAVVALTDIISSVFP